jgi:hypothetical protein
MKVGVANNEVLNQSIIFADFDLKLYEFKQRMMVQVVRTLMPFLASSMAYNHYGTHNILMIMFILEYKMYSWAL